jgi:nucleotide-binding universal stress UspA family protein
MADKIVIAVDGSSASDEATVVGLDLATARGASVVFVLFVLASDTEDRSRTPHLQEDIEQTAWFLGEAARAAQARGVNYELEVITLQPEDYIASAIAELADAIDATLIVVGARSNPTIGLGVLGGVSHGLLSISPRPVVVARAPQEDAE